MESKDFESIYPQFVGHFDKLDRLAKLVEAKSKEINITAIRDYDSIWQKHIIDSLSSVTLPIMQEKIKSGGYLIDVGTGGGFPGLPVAITNPSLQVTLLDSTKKKLTVVDGFISDLDIENVHTVWGRAEDLSKHVTHAKNYDIVVARGVAFLPDLIHLVRPFVKDNGLICLYKQNGQEEIDAGLEVAKKENLRLEFKFEYSLDNGQVNDRVILIFRPLI